MVAGELSGDLLGGSVMRAFKTHCDVLELRGVGGPHLQACGLHSAAPMDRLSVMGLVEPLQRLPELVRLRRRLRQVFLDDPPDLFLGIDAPDFNLPLARDLRAAGVRTAHLVSPTVWAWRRGRLRTIRAAVDRMFCLFPFELPIYQAHGIPASFVGHPLADELAERADQGHLRKELGLPQHGRVLALLPGSRPAEVHALGTDFAEVARRLWEGGKIAAVALPVATPACRRALQPALNALGNMPNAVLDGAGRDAIGAADVVLTAAGTATLEAALLGRPMVVAYRTSTLNWWILSRLVDTPFIALPNLLAGKSIVPEFLQASANVDALYTSVAAQLEAPSGAMLAEFATQSAQLRCGFAQRTALGLLDVINSSSQERIEEDICK